MSNITKVYLLNVPLENDYKNTLYFADSSAQYNYFKSKVVKSYTDFNYQRKDNFIRIPDDYDSLLNCNYVMYQNTTVNNKWFYAFITDIKYVNTDRTDVYIETDVMQTWLKDYVVKDSFVEREHVEDDTIGLHTQPEQLETGDYICNNNVSVQHLMVNCFIVGATIDLSYTGDGKYPSIAGAEYNGVYSGVKYFYFPDSESISNALKKVAEKGQSDAINSIFIAPSRFIETHSDGGIYEIVESKTCKAMKWSDSILGLDSAPKIYKPTNINGYTPKNNKLFTYPYTYLNISNNAGGNAIYKYELFKNENNNNLCDFYITFALTPSCSIRLLPIYYNGVNESITIGTIDDDLGQYEYANNVNNEEGLTGPKFPVCSWNNDVYTNWLTQNAINLPTQIASSALTIAGGIGLMATGAGVGSIASGITGITSTIGEVYQHSLQPPQVAGNVNSGDVTLSMNKLLFTGYQMSIKKEYAEVIDNYFTCYGYKVNKVKKPNTNHRKRFWYTKTIDVNIDGPIPNNDMQKIKDCYNRGITFWKSADNMNDYTSENGTI